MLYIQVISKVFSAFLSRDGITLRFIAKIKKNMIGCTDLGEKNEKKLSILTHCPCVKMDNSMPHCCHSMLRMRLMMMVTSVILMKPSKLRSPLCHMKSATSLPSI